MPQRINHIKNIFFILQIDKYIHNTGDETHYRIDIVQIFMASREGESERFKEVRMHSP